MQIVASAGNGASLLIAESPSADEAQVWVRRTNELHPPHSRDAIVKFGGWVAYEGDEDADEIISGASVLQTKGQTTS